MSFSSKIFPPFWACCTVGLLAGCGGAPPPGGEPAGAATSPVAPPTTVPAGPLVDTTSYVFDLPALVPLTADQVRARLGKPDSDEQESINEEMKTLIYYKKGYKLLINYEVPSRRLIGLYFYPTKSWQKYPHLLQQANVREGEAGYSVTPANEANGLCEGIDIMPDSARVQDSFGHWVPIKQAQ